MHLARHFFCLLTLSAITFAVAPIAAAQDAQPAARNTGGASLEANMKSMNRAFKAIGRQIDDASKDAETLALVDTLQAATAAAKGQTPHNVETMEGEAKAKALAEYRQMMLQSLKDTIELEEALLAGNREAAKAAHAKIDKLMREGHRAYRVDH